jgi:hypothetical protein
LIGSTFVAIRKRLFDQMTTSNNNIRRAEHQRLLSRSNPQSEASISSRLSMLKVSSSSSVSSNVTINGPS